jgi:hypothetical protein
MSESEPVAVQVTDAVIAQSPRPVPRRLDDLDTLGTLEFVQLVDVTNNKVNGAALRIWRALLQENLHLPQIHPRHGGRIAPRKSQPETELARVEIDRGPDIADLKTRVVLFAFHLRRIRSFHTYFPIAA